MPSDEMVEKAQTLDDAIDNALIAWGMGWDMDGVMACLKEAKDRAALAAAEAGEPVAWQLRRVVGWEPPGEWVDVPRERAERLGNQPGIETRALYTRPPSEAAIRADERAAIRKEAFEEAAKVADDHAEAWGAAMASPAIVIATAIRARGET